MLDSINSISHKVLCYWLQNDIVNNFSLFSLFVKISKLSYDIPNRYEELFNVIAYIEDTFSIPVSIDIDKWLSESKTNYFIYGVYQNLADLINC